MSIDSNLVSPRLVAHNATESAALSLLQCCLYTLGSAVGTLGVRPGPSPLALFAGLSVPIALTVVEAMTRQRVSCAGIALREEDRARLMGFVGLAALAAVAYAPSYTCPIVLVTCLAGFGLEHVLASSRVALWLFPLRRHRRRWAPVHVLSLSGGIATLRTSQGHIILARAERGVCPGPGFANIRYSDATYRANAAAQILGFESRDEREHHRLLGRLAMLRFASGLAWGAVIALPFYGKILSALSNACDQ